LQFSWKPPRLSCIEQWCARALGVVHLTTRAPRFSKRKKARPTLFGPCLVRKSGPCGPQVGHGREFRPDRVEHTVGISERAPVPQIGLGLLQSSATRKGEAQKSAGETATLRERWTARVVFFNKLNPAEQHRAVGLRASLRISLTSLSRPVSFLG
jgi:hypothetical protein